MEINFLIKVAVDLIDQTIITDMKGKSSKLSK